MSNSHQGLLVIKASAGSGKTYTLAKRYIELLLFTVGDDGLLRYRKQAGYHAHILAITFTNKATAEMKNRIVNELFILATDPVGSKFYQDFVKAGDTFAPDVLQPERVSSAAADALAAILHDYGTFNVSTIDSFFQSILRNFARELDRDYNYEVQIDQDFAMRTAIHNFLLSLGTDSRRMQGSGSYRLSDIERWVQDCIRQQVSQGRGWNFFKDDGGLFSFASLMNTELFRQQMPAIHAYLTAERDGVRVSDLSRINAFKKRIIELARAYGDIYEEFAGTMRQLVDDCGVDETKIYGGRFVANMLKPGNVFARRAEPKPLREVTEEKLQSTYFKNNYTPPIEFVEQVIEWRDRALFVWYAWQLLTKMPDDLGMLALLSRIDDNVKEYSRETNQLLLADTNELISRVLDSGVPFLYERVGTWINHFMIDEFQDTSHKQYDNFLPLLSEALSHHDENLCMLIGDAKQSIYRFRNADPSLFRDGITRDFTARDHGLREHTLTTNYRSCPAIIEFNNRFFDQLLQQPDFKQSDTLQRTYAPGGDKTQFQQSISKKSPRGMVRVRLYGENTPLPDTQAVLDLLPGYLHGLHDRFEWGEIGILVNRKFEGNDIVARIMEYNKTVAPDMQIPVASDESMLVANSPGVKRIVSLLRFIDLTQYHLPEDTEREPDAPVRDDERSLQYRLREQRLYHVLGKFMERMAGGEMQPSGQVLVQCFRDTDAQQQLSPQEQMQAFASEVTSLLPDNRTELLTLTNIVEHLIARYMSDTHTMPHETAHLLAFQDCVNDFSTQRSGGTVREFLNYWDTKCTSLTVPSSAGDDAVTVMTIHKSKGLEFDCVLVPFANWRLVGENTRPERTSNIYWISRDDLLAQGGGRIFDQAGGIDLDLIPPLLPLSKGETRRLAALGCLASFVDNYEQDVLVDNVDKTYVTFTRAGREMHLFVEAKSGLGKLMHPMLEQEVADGRELCVTDAGDYEWGKAEVVQKDAPEPDEGADNEWMADLKTMPPYRVAVGTARITARLPEDLTDKQNTGTRLHNLMSRIGHRRDVQRAWDFCLNRGIIRTDDQQWPLERIRGVLDRMFEDPRTASWFDDDNEVYNERSLSSGRATGGKTKRPDRVVRRPDGSWLVIDYKFGDKNLLAHSAQVRAYMRRLRAMGKQPVGGFVWYVALDEVVPVELSAKGDDRAGCE